MSACTRCGTIRYEVERSHAAQASVCLTCHLRAAAAAATEGTGRPLLDLAADLRRDAHDLADVADRLGSRRLRAIAAKLGQIPVLLEVGSERQTPHELVVAAARLQADANKITGARR